MDVWELNFCFYPSAGGKKEVCGILNRPKNRPGRGIHSTYHGGVLIYHRRERLVPKRAHSISGNGCRGNPARTGNLAKNITERCFNVQSRPRGYCKVLGHNPKVHLTPSFAHVNESTYIWFYGVPLSYVVPGTACICAIDGDDLGQ